MLSHGRTLGANYCDRQFECDSMRPGHIYATATMCQLIIKYVLMGINECIFIDCIIAYKT